MATPAQAEYDHTQDSRYTLKDCEGAVGCTATLSLTGRVIKARESERGPCVIFEVDERWGFGSYRLGLDLDALEID